jgi:3-isopropylmalate/(R)-2-methylmalate dehydratase small subunit
MKKRFDGRVCRLGHDFHPMQFLPNQGAQNGLKLSERGATEKAIDWKSGDIILAGRNFGCNRSCDDIVPALLAQGIPGIIAVSFTRQFYRASINGGLPLIESADAFEKISSGETITIDFERNEIQCGRGIISFPMYHEVISKILHCGGIISYTRKAIGK